MVTAMALPEMLLRRLLNPRRFVELLSRVPAHQLRLPPNERNVLERKLRPQMAMATTGRLVPLNLLPLKNEPNVSVVLFDLPPE
jgi:hypothetical protein